MRSVLCAAALSVCVPAAAQPQASPDTLKTALAEGIATEAHTNAANMTGAAEAMPAEKYGFKPTPQQVSFGDLIFHAANANYSLCGAIGGEKAPELATKADGPKQALIDQMKASFAFCDRAFERIDPATLNQPIQMFGRSVTRAWIMFHLALDWGDHYSQAASYLRQNGITPPSAARRTGR